MMDNLKRVNESLNAVVNYVNHEVQSSGKLSGFVVALKDNINMKDTLTTASCKLLSNHMSIYNAHVVDLLVNEGAHIVAKTSMDELGMGGTNLSALTGPVYNPHDTSRISGGSSGGSAALVGSKAVRLALGSDTGDSVRKPAAYCGVVGVKPTYGRISRYGVIPYASSLDHVGYFTQNVSDAALSLEVLAGHDARDMTSSEMMVDAYSKLLDMDLKGKRIGVFKTVLDSIQSREIVELFHDFLDKLEKKGAILVYQEMNKKLLRTLLPTYLVISNCEATANHANLDGVRYGLAQEGESLEEIMMKTRTEGFSFNIKERFIYGAYGLDDKNQDEVFNQAKRVRRLIVDAYARLFGEVDVIIAPAAPQIAPKIDASPVDKLSDEYLIADNHMVINNFTGYPSMTMPFGRLNGMPLGVNLSTRPFDEKTLFAFGSAFESVIQWEDSSL